MTIPTESQEQVTLFAWAHMSLAKYPELEWLFHVPNGGYRNAREAQRLKKEGVKAGVPDVCLPIPRGGYHSLYIELKRQAGGSVSPDQKKWLEALKNAGHKAVVCKGFEMAKEEIINYLNGEQQ